MSLRSFALVCNELTHRRCLPRQLPAPPQNVKCLGLVNENVAVALAYGMYRNAKGEFDLTSETITMFVDMGDAAFTYVLVMAHAGMGVLDAAALTWSVPVLSHPPPLPATGHLWHFPNRLRVEFVSHVDFQPDPPPPRASLAFCPFFWQRHHRGLRCRQAARYLNRV
jgi:hypothetical protein